LYFTEAGVGRIGSVAPLAADVVGSLVQSAVVPSGSAAGLADITLGQDGKVWFTESAANRVANITPDLATITELPLPVGPNRPVGIAAGPDGNVWFADADAGKVGRIALGGVVTLFPIPTPKSSPTGISAGSDGALWFTEATADKIGRITTAGAVTEPASLPAGSAPAEIAGGPDGALWFAEAGTNKIGRVSPSGALSEFSALTAASAPTGIAAGADGALWFSEAGANRIGRVTIPDPGNQGPQGLPGQPGSTGAQGLPGPQARLVLIAFNARVTRRTVVVRYVLTAGVPVTLSVKTSRRGRPVLLGRARGRSGINEIRWNRRLHGKRVPIGRYTLIVSATLGGRTVSSSLTVRLRT
jgi:virginiamycin B lyase